MIPVTKSFLPPLEEYVYHVKRSFNNNWLTNRGELVKELENKLVDFLDLNESELLCLNNGTIPIQIALKLFGDKGEIITTPFSYVATSSAIIWENCTPVYVDIHPDYLTIDESKIEPLITEKTTCILATHVFGNPCNIEEIERIAKKHNLKVIYDAAHCFGVKYKGRSIFEYGDISTCSFHSTKLFHTGEGGAIFCSDKSLMEKIFLSHAFGHIGDNHIQLGINGKMSELHAAMGLSVLSFIPEIIKHRKNNFLLYKEKLGKKFKFFKIRDNVDFNYNYVPIIFSTETQLLSIKRKLEEKNIYPRRYFYPSLNKIEYIKNNFECIESQKISNRILCLPNYFDLSETQVKYIIKTIL